MKLKHLFYAAALLYMVTLFSGCSDDDDNAIVEATSVVTSNGLYITNSGNYYSNLDGTLSFIDFGTSTVSNKVFYNVNGQSLGATPQDAVVYGSSMYIAVYESNLIWVVDKNTVQLKETITPTSGMGYPRDIVASDGYVYVSMYDGYVSRIDTASLTIDKTIDVGPNPEEMAVANGYLYVANSDGMNYGNGYIDGLSVSKINLSTFTESKKITVGLNPTKIVATEDGNVYVLAMGDYYTVDAVVQQIDADDNVTDVVPATLMAVKDNTLYLINDPYYGVGTTYFTYDTTTGTSGTLVDDADVVEYPAAIAVDPVTGQIYISSYSPISYDGGITYYADYYSDGYVKEYTASGTFIKQYTVGVGPCGMNFLLSE